MDDPKLNQPVKAPDSEPNQFEAAEPAPTPRQIQSRTAELIASKQDLLDIICGHVSSGGALSDLCEAWGVSFGSIMIWITTNENRRDAWMAANHANAMRIDEQTLGELQSIAHADIRDLFDGNNLKHIKDLPDDIAKCIQSIEVVELFEGSGRDKRHIGYTHKIKFWDKMKALEMIAKHRGLLVDKVHVEGKLTLEDLILGKTSKGV